MLTAGVVLAPSPEELRELRRKQLVRRRMEHELIGKLDKRGIANLREDCWFLMDAQWVARWMEYTKPGLLSEEEQEAMAELPPAPGPVSSRRLLETDVAPTSGGVPLSGLHSVTDYRGVPSLVYFAFVELHGKDASPEIARYAVDIYRPAVPIERLMPIRFRAQTTSSILVDKIRPNWVTWERHYSDDENDIDDNGRAPPLWCCCGLTRDHIEVIIYWAILCCTRASRKASGRKNISYSKYKPLKYREGDSTHGLEMEEAAGKRGSRDDGDADTVATGADDDDDDGSGDSDDNEGGAVEEYGRDYHTPLFKTW